MATTESLPPLPEPCGNLASDPYDGHLFTPRDDAKWPFGDLFTGEQMNARYLQGFADGQAARTQPLPNDVRRALASAKRALENWCDLHPDQRDALDTIAFEAIDAVLQA